MNNRESRRYEMFLRVTAFGKEHAADFAPSGEALKHFGKLGEISVALGAASASQRGGGATAKAVLLDALRLDLQNIARTARAIAQDLPGFADKFGLPANFGQLVLTTAATGYLAELKKPGVAERFVAHELPAGFDQHLADDLVADCRRARRPGSQPGNGRGEHRDGGDADRRWHARGELPRCDHK